MYEVRLIATKDSVTARIKQDSTNVVMVIPMTVEDALKVRPWLNGMIIDAPIEVVIGGKEYYFDYDIWKPLRHAINEWYEDNYA